MKNPTIISTYHRILILLVVLGLMTGCAQNAGQSTSQPKPQTNIVTVVMATELGDLELELYQDKAPVSVANFLRYVAAGKYDGGTFFRIVRPQIDPSHSKITVVQADIRPNSEELATIKLETTQQTGLKHLDGSLSMARNQQADSAAGSFFICIGAQPALDFGGARIADGLGFAVFGRVTKGMEIVKKINQIRQTKIDDEVYIPEQILVHPVVINQASIKARLKPAL